MALFAIEWLWLIWQNFELVPNGSREQWVMLIGIILYIVSILGYYWICHTYTTILEQLVKLRYFTSENTFDFLE